MVWQSLRKKNKAVGLIYCCCMLIVTLVTTAQAKEIPESIAAQIIVGEASDQGLKGMICIGEVLRHRGSIKGFYGYHSNVVRNESPAVWKMAAQAWRKSAETNYTNGADHFENIHRFGKPWWVKYCRKTYEYKDHVFYKEVRRH